MYLCRTAIFPWHMSHFHGTQSPGLGAQSTRETYLNPLPLCTFLNLTFSLPFGVSNILNLLLQPCLMLTLSIVRSRVVSVLYSLISVMVLRDYQDYSNFWKQSAGLWACLCQWAPCRPYCTTSG